MNKSDFSSLEEQNRISIKTLRDALNSSEFGSKRRMDTSSVIVLYGPSGFGKTISVNLLKETLADGGKIFESYSICS